MRSSRPKYLETSLSGKATDHEARCMASILESRRAESDRRLTALRKSLSKATKREEGRACVYLTGSFARGEASPHSDLDLFIVSREGKDGKPELSRLNEICIKADL